MKYQRKVKFVEAIQFDGSKDSVSAIVDFMNSDAIQVVYKGNNPTLLVKVKEINYHVDLYDYVVALSNGKFLSCSSRIFEAGFEKVE